MAEQRAHQPKCKWLRAYPLGGAPGSHPSAQLHPYDWRMSAWFTVAVSPKVGSLAAVTAALASAGIAVEGVMGAPEVDGSLHLGVPDAQLPAAIATLAALGLHPITEESDPTGEAGAPLDAGIIGAILRGPRS